MTLIAILIATLAAGTGSVWLAAGLTSLGMQRPGNRDLVDPQCLLSLAAGALLATAFMHLLPEAFESQAGSKELFATLLMAVVFFFLLDKAELWHHGHEHHHGHAQELGPVAKRSSSAAEYQLARKAPACDAHCANAHSHRQLRSGGWAVLAGDSVHCFGDGVLIASAFMADLRLGFVAALAVLRETSGSRRGLWSRSRSLAR